MDLITKSVKGTQDVLPKESYKWQFIEKIMREEAQAHSFKEIRTPVFEHTELFQRSVGDTTDVVQKEMYTFNTKGEDSITLRPEGTAGSARAILEHGVYNDGYPIKAYYFTSCYRYEKPQKGRLREFHQFGMEVYGAASYFADAEVICAADSIFKRLGVKGLNLEINSIGCPNCRANYHKALKEYFAEHTSELCETCLSRLEKNPMRILDCKSPICSKIAEKAPTVLDYICDDCREHFEGVKKCLDSVGIEYTVNPTIVRGLDYYTRTVFEFVSSSIGAQGTVCGGGRYDGLIEELGGQHTPSLGYAIGIERLLLLLEAQGIEIPAAPTCDIYIAGLGEKAQLKSFELVKTVRSSSLSAECDIVGRSLKAQMKYADKIGAKFSIVLGDSEIESGKAQLKNMETGEKAEISLGENFFSDFYNIYIQSQFAVK
ncbi:MAG: histidine--tRNA ligase [Pseudoruminococcus massiliensis]|jgi:histidyl-tRNA synthetase|uniref:histidine--tRNA ligase n=1 Tax=Pseudoruminococcus massiliensis TaxID=2086583 RepID=UPI003992006A|nr:histidine--tRNA ligase [Oscillospiraceae bacterium]